jgi:hypothetical protein
MCLDCGSHWARSNRVQLWISLACMNAFVLVLPWFAPVQTAVLPAFLGGHFPFLSVCLVATFLFHLVTLPSEVWRLLGPVAVLSEVPSLLGVRWPGWSPPFGCGLALSATLLRLALALRAHGPERERHWRALADALVPPTFFAATVGLLGLASYLAPFTRDLEIQRIGGVLGPWPPIIVARWFEGVSPMRVLCQAIYVLLPVELAVVHGLSFRQRPDAHPTLLIAFVLIPLIGYPLYLALPMVGPREAWHCLNAKLAFPPGAVPDVATLLLKPEAAVARNCMPSLHTAWTLAALFQARRVSRGAWCFAAVWFAGTELATLGLGEHWLIDLVVAVPFACLAYALADGAAQYRERRRALVLLGALVCAWIVALRTCSAALAPHPTLVQLAMLATPLLALAIARRLWGVADGSVAEARAFDPAQDSVAAAQL